MDYEEKYKETLEKARQLCAYPTTKPLISDLQDLFPELKESEDEKIRKELIKFVKVNIPNEERYIAWLEKQGTSYTKKDVDDVYLKGVTDTKKELEKQYEETYQIRKDIATFIFNYRGDIKDRAKWMDYLGIKVSFVEKQGEQKHETPIPRFNIGDWVIVHNKDAYQVIGVNTYDYRLQHYLGGKMNYPFKYESDLKPWTIQDAKDGDVLARNNDILSICIFSYFNGINNKFSSFLCHCGLEGEGLGQGLSINGYHDDSKNYVPATKEQRDTLIKAMTDAGYTFDFEKKELKKIEEYGDFKNQVMSEITDLVKDYITQKLVQTNFIRRN